MTDMVSKRATMTCTAAALVSALAELSVKIVNNGSVGFR